MPQIFAVILAVLFALYGGERAQGQEQFVPAVDISSVKTFEDLQSAKSAAWDHYSSRKSEAWTTYDQAKSAAWKIYSDAEHEALLTLRGSDYVNYLQWLDARETRDYDRFSELSETTPALVNYEEVKATAFVAYSITEAQAYGVYLITEANAHAVYLQEEAMAEAAYKVAAAEDQ